MKAGWHNAKRTCLLQTVTAVAVRETTSQRGNDYTTFKLQNGGDSLSIFMWGHPPLGNGDRVQVEGVPAPRHFGAVLELPAPRLCFGTGACSLRHQTGRPGCSVRQTLALQEMWQRQRDGATTGF